MVSILFFYCVTVKTTPKINLEFYSDNLAFLITFVTRSIEKCSYVIRRANLLQSEIIDILHLFPILKSLKLIKA